MADQENDLKFNIGVASNSLKQALDQAEAQIERIARTLANLEIGFASAEPGSRRTPGGRAGRAATGFTAATTQTPPPSRGPTGPGVSTPSGPPTPPVGSGPSPFPFYEDATGRYRDVSTGRFVSEKAWYSAQNRARQDYESSVRAAGRPERTIIPEAVFRDVSGRFVSMEEYLRSPSDYTREVRYKRAGGGFATHAEYMDEQNRIWQSIKHDPTMQDRKERSGRKKEKFTSDRERYEWEDWDISRRTWERWAGFGQGDTAAEAAFRMAQEADGPARERAKAARRTGWRVYAEKNAPFESEKGMGPAAASASVMQSGEYDATRTQRSVFPREKFVDATGREVSREEYQKDPVGTTRQIHYVRKMVDANRNEVEVPATKQEYLSEQAEIRRQILEEQTNVVTLDTMRRRQSGFQSDTGTGSAAASAQTLSSWRARLRAGMAQLPSVGGNIHNWFEGLSPYMQQFAHGMMITLGRSSAEFVNALTMERMTGRPDIAGRAAAGWSLVGGTLGAGVGSLFGGFGGVVGAGVGGQVGSAIGQFFMAPTLRNINIETRLLPLASMYTFREGLFGSPGGRTGAVSVGGDGQASLSIGTLTPAPSLFIGRSLRTRALNRANFLAQTSFGGDTSYAATGEQIAEAYDTLSDALWQAGLDPFERVGFGVGLEEEKRIVGYRKKKVEKTRMVPRKRTQEFVIPGIERRFPFISQGLDFEETFEEEQSQISAGGTRRTGVELTEKGFSLGKTEPGRTTTDRQRSTVRRRVKMPDRFEWKRFLEPDRRIQIETEEYVPETYTEEVDDLDNPIYEKTYRPEVTVQSRVERYAERLAQRFGIGIDQAQKILSPVLASEAIHRGNLADILSTQGMKGLMVYQAASYPYGQAFPVSYSQALSATRALQTLPRDIEWARAGFRGQGAAVMSAYSPVRNAIGRLPGGQDSLIYRQLTKASFEEGIVPAMQEEHIEKYEIPRVLLQGESARMQYLPFSPGNIFRNTLSQIALNTSQASELQRRMAAWKDSGYLSEAMELEMTQRIESLRTANAAGIAQLSEGFENRLPALSAGRPAHFARFNSLTLAALNLWHMQSPVRSFGAYGGTQLRDQNQFFRSFGVDESVVLPGSTTQEMNNAPLIKALRDLTRALEAAVGRAGSAGRRGEGGGNMPTSSLFN